MDKTWHNAEIVEIIDEAPKIKRFRIKLPDLDLFSFIPGQFVAIELPIHEDPKKRVRYYSIASNPDGSNVFELVIVLKDDGLGTSFLFFKCDVGFKFKVQGANGKFRLPENIEKDLCFICTGTGLAPFRSMIRHIYRNKIEHKDIHLFFGTRFEEEILYRMELDQLASEHPEFHFHVSLSRDENFTEVPGKLQSGYIHSAYEKEFADKRPANFYLCGWSGMIQEAKSRLWKLGYTNADLFQEVYG